MAPRAKDVAAWLRDRRTSLDSSSVFLMCWCGAIVGHYDSRMYWETNILFVLAPALAFLGMWFARSKVLMLAILAVTIAGAWAKMPTPDNHWFFAGLVSLGIAIGIVVQTVRDRGLRPLDEAWFVHTVPPLRVLVILLYLFAVFHKFNWDYIDPDLSCAVSFYNRATRTPLMPPLWTDTSVEFRHFLVWGILTLEFSIPAFLLRRRTWFVGIALGFTFHMMTAAFMRHFPCIMFAAYFLFVPNDRDAGVDVRHELVNRLEALARRLTWGWLGFRELFFAQSVFWSAWSIRVWMEKARLGITKDALESGYFHFLRAWNVSMVLGFVLVALIVARHGFWRRSERGYLGTRWWPLQALPLFFVLNSFSPFWGLKTSTSLAMWSNLLTANHYTNHLVIPTDALKIFPYMDDVVVVESTSVASWRKTYVRRKQFMVWISLQRRVQEFDRRRPKEPLRLTYVRDGQRIVLEDATKDPEIMAPQSLVFRKYVHVKDHRLDNKGTCTW